MNILITSAGQRVSLVRAFQQELKRIYPTGKVFTTDMCPGLSAACNVSDQYFEVRRVTDPGYIDELLTLCLEYDIRMVIPTIDTELVTLAQHKDLFCRKGVHLIISSLSFIELCRDKRKTHIFFEELGIPTPAMIDKHNPSFPLFIKPYDGSLSVDTFIANSRKDITEYHLTNEKFLFMEYLNKKDYDEHTVDMYFDKSGHIKCIVPRKRIWVRAGEINKGITSKNHIVPYLKEKLGYIEGAAGCITAQFFLHRTTERIVAIEINARFGGGYPLSYRAGANYPLWLIKEYLNNESIDYTDNWEDELLMLRYDGEVIIHGNKN